MDDANDKIIIYLATEMAKDVYYVVKAKFYGNMTHDKGFYFTYYDDVNDPSEAEDVNITTNTKFFAATFLEPKSARELFPCFDGEWSMIIDRLSLKIKKTLFFQRPHL